MDCLKIDNVLVSDPKLMANNLNIFFTSVAQKIADEIHPTDRPPDIAISNDVPVYHYLIFLIVRLPALKLSKLLICFNLKKARILMVCQCLL